MDKHEDHNFNLRAFQVMQFERGNISISKVGGILSSSVVGFIYLKI